MKKTKEYVTIDWMKGYHNTPVNTLQEESGFIQGENFFIGVDGVLYPRHNYIVGLTFLLPEGFYFTSMLYTIGGYIGITQDGRVWSSPNGTTYYDLNQGAYFGGNPIPKMTGEVGLFAWEGNKVLITSTLIKAVWLNIDTSFVPPEEGGTLAWKYIGCVPATPYTPPVQDYTIGIGCIHEARFFIGKYNTLYYSTRDEPSTGYNITAGNEFVSFDSNDRSFAGLFEVSGAMYILLGGAGEVGFSVFRKSAVLKAGGDLIGADQFVEIISDYDLNVINYKQMVVCDGKIFIWLKGMGLCFIDGDNITSVSERIKEVVGLANDSYFMNVVVLASTSDSLVLCKATSSSYCWVYDVKRQMWFNWTGISDITGKIIGDPKRMFLTVTGGIYLKDRSITTAVNMLSYNIDGSYPFVEKSIRHIYIDGNVASGAITVVVKGRKRIGGTQSTILTTTITPSGVSTVNVPNNNTYSDFTIQLVGTGMTLKQVVVELEYKRRFK